MHVEQALIDRLGDVGRKLHTGRSRNDQVVTDLRLWSRDAIDRLDDRRCGSCSRPSSAVACGTCDVVLPAYTHLQRAQPVLAPHYWLAYCEKFQRDRERLRGLSAASQRVQSGGCRRWPGTSLPIDRHDVARRLGFDRGGSQQPGCLQRPRLRRWNWRLCLALIAEHLSGWAEEWILWSTTEFSFLKLPQAFCTGSSIMPQKINPDVLELIRGRTARVVGNLQTLLVLIKGLAAGLQPRPAGRQTAVVRFGRHRLGLFGLGRPDRPRSST